MSPDPFTPLPGVARPVSSKPKWTPVLPVPAGAPPAPRQHPKLGVPSATWTYTDAAGAVLGYVGRFDVAPSEKVFRPLIYMKADSGAKAEWRWESWPPKRPLYGLQQLAQKVAALVVVTEGEKAADAAAKLLPGVAVVTSPNGSRSAGKADWSPLRNRRVVLWP